MYNIKSSNGIYYLKHSGTNVLAKLDQHKFVQALDDHFQLTPANLSKLTYAIYVGDFQTADEIINL